MMNTFKKGSVPRIKQPAITPTVRAGKVKPDEYNELIRWSEWDVDRAFHFLNGTPKYHHTLLKKNSLYRLGLRIKILDKEKCDISGYKVGKLYKENSKYFFVCRDGKIYVNIVLSPANLLDWAYSFIS